MALPTSGPNFDFSMFPRRYWGEALGQVGGDIGDALRWRREQERKEESDRQKAKFENDQNTNSERRAREIEARDKLHEAQGQAGLRGGLAKNLSGLLGQGRTDEAQATAKASVFADRAGNPAGVGLKKMLLGSGGQLEDYTDLPPAGAAAGPAPEPTSQGQILSRFLGNQPRPETLEPPAFGQEPQEPAPDMARAAAGLASLGGQASLLQTAGVAADQDKQASDAYQSAQQQSTADQAAQEKDRAGRVRWQMSFPSGETQTIDPNQGKAAMRADAEDRASQLEAAAAREANPDTRAAMIRQASLIRTQLSNADKAPITNTAAQENSQEFKVGRDERNQLTREEQLRKAALAGAHRTGALADFDRLKTEQKRIQAASAYEPVVQNVLHKYGFEKVQDQQAQMADLFNMSELASTDPAAATMLAGRYAKFSQGAGVLTDQDMKTFYYNIGGKMGFLDANGSPDFTRINNKIREYLTGTVDPQFTENIRGALKGLGHTIDHRTNEIGGAIETRLRGLGANEDTVQSYLGSYAPNYVAHGPGTRGDVGNQSLLNPSKRPRAAPAAAPPAAAPAGARPPSALVDQARQRAAKGDTKARDWLAGWGL